MPMSKSLAPINDINLKIFDEICEERFGNIDLEAVLVSIIDNVPADALPHLAEQYHITGNEGWLQCRNDEEKKDLIKRSIEVHRYKGTKYALKKIFDMFGLEGHIKEWFETNGEPYTFTVDINFVSKGLDFDLIERLEDLINEYKNVRSHLASLSIGMSSELKNYKNKLISITGECTTIYPFQKSLIWDESDWDEAYWSKKIDEERTLPVCKWDESNFDESVWSFG
jgi:phage tail P2-like protein